MTLERICDKALISKLKLTDYITIISSIVEAICFFNWNFSCHLLFFNQEFSRNSEEILSSDKSKKKFFLQNQMNVEFLKYSIILIRIPCKDTQSIRKKYYYHQKVTKITTNQYKNFQNDAWKNIWQSIDLKTQVDWLYYHYFINSWSYLLFQLKFQLSSAFCH